MSEKIVDWHSHSDDDGILWVTLDKQNTDLTGQMSTSTKTNKNLQGRLGELEAGHKEKRGNRWRELLAWTTALLVVGFTFFFLGALWYRHRASEKLGGLTI